MGSYGTAPANLSKAPDYAKITDFDNLIKQTKNKKSPFYYPTLLEKFMAGEELTNEQVYMLLIGYTDQKDYKPYSMDAGKVYQLNSQGNFDEAIQSANDLLKTNPLSPSLYAELMYAYRKKSDMEMGEKYQEKVRSLLDAMLYTGDGSCEKPYVVFWVREEYSLLYYLNLDRAGGVSTVSCAGQMADQMQVINVATKYKSEVNFNITLIFKNAMGK